MRLTAHFSLTAAKKISFVSIMHEPRSKERKCCIFISFFMFCGKKSWMRRQPFTKEWKFIHSFVLRSHFNPSICAADLRLFYHSKPSVIVTFSNEHSRHFTLFKYLGFKSRSTMIAKL